MADRPTGAPGASRTDRRFTPSSTRLRIVEAQVQDNALARGGGGSAVVPRPTAPTSAPSASASERGTQQQQASKRVVASKRPHSGPSSLMPLDGSTAAPSSAEQQGLASSRSAATDADDAHSAVLSSRAPSSARPASTVVSATSTALRSAALAALEQALGHDLPLQMKTRVRAVRGTDGDADRPDAAGETGGEALLEDVYEGLVPDEAGNIPRTHVVLTASDVKSIKDSETLRFLEQYSRTFLKYVGEAGGSTDAGASSKPPRPPSGAAETSSSRIAGDAAADAHTDEPPATAVGDEATDVSASTRDLFGDSMGNTRRSLSRTGPRASRDGPPLQRQASNDGQDINVLAAQLCEEIATFITTVDDQGDSYVIATDTATGQLRVPIDLDAQDDDVGVVDDLRGMEGLDEDDDDVDLNEEDGATGATAAAAEPLPALVDDDDDDDDDLTGGKQASAFAEALLKMRRDRAANERAGNLEARSRKKHGHVVDADLRRRLNEVEEIAEELDQLEQTSSPFKTRSTTGQQQQHTASAAATAERSPAVTPPKPPQRRGSSAGAVKFDESAAARTPHDGAGAVKLFQPTVGPAPTKRIEALMKLSSKDARPRYMKGTRNRTGTTASDAEQAIPAADTAKESSAQSGPESPVKVKSSMSAAKRDVTKAKQQRQAAATTQSKAVGGDGDSAADGAADAAAPEVRPQKPVLSRRLEKRIDWLVAAGDDWAEAVPDVAVAAGDDNDASVYDPTSAHTASAASGYQVPQRVRDIDEQLKRFESSRVDGQVPQLDLDAVVSSSGGAEASDGMYSLAPSRPITARTSGDAVPDEEELTETTHDHTQAAAATPLSSPHKKKPAAAPTTPSRAGASPKKGGASGPQQQQEQQPSAVTAAAEEARKQEERRKALGAQYIAEQREARVTKKKLAAINDRLAAINVEVSKLHEPRFAPASSLPTGGAAAQHEDPAGGMDALVVRAMQSVPVMPDDVRPPSPSEIERMVEVARREQLRASWGQAS